MNGRGGWAWAAACVLGVVASASGQYEPGSATAECRTRLMEVCLAVHNWASEHDRRYPADLSVIAGEERFSLGEDERSTIADRIRKWFVTPGREGSVPDDATSEWIRENSSYEYLGRTDVSMTDIPSWDKVIIAHLKPEFAHPAPVTEENPEGEWITIVPLTSHAEIVTRREFERRVKLSKAIMEAAATGKPFPDAVEVEWGIGALNSALHAYAKSHDDYLPADIGSLLEHLPVDSKRLGTARDRARVFLTPHAARNMAIPEDADAAWINQHASYVYLGNERSRMREIDDHFMIVLHAKFDATVGEGVDGRPFRGVLMQAIKSRYEVGVREYAEGRAREARAYFEAVKARTELPDPQHALRDLRYINRAIRAYAKANGGKLPRDLGATLEFLPADEFTGKNAANIYLSPRAQRGRGDVPERPDAEWVRANASYEYLGSDQMTLKDFRQFSVLVHSPMGESFPVRHHGEVEEGAGVLTPGGSTWCCPLTSLEVQVAEVRGAK